MIVGAGHLITGPKQDDAGLVAGDFVLGKAAVGDEDREVARIDEASGGTVHLDFTRTAVDHVGRETRAVVDVEDVNLLELLKPGDLAEFAVHRDRALVFGVGGGDGCAVQLGFEKGAIHGRKGANVTAEAAWARPG